MPETRPMFEEVSDEDSISTESTAPSEERAEYTVDELLAERKHPQHGLEYLIKWEGYPLHRATWEPPKNIIHRDLIQQFQKDKRLVKQGLKQAFDVDNWAAAIEDNEVAKDVRKARRRAKRRRRGINVSSPDDSDDDEVTRKNQSVRKQVKQPRVPRKGIAQPISKKRTIGAITDSSDSDVSKYSDEDDDISGFEPPLGEAEDAAQQQLSAARRDSGNAPVKPIQPKKQRAEGERTAKRPKSMAVSREKSLFQPPVQTAASTAARKSAPSMVTSSASISAPAAITTITKGSKKNILANWGTEKKRKERPRVSGETPKDSMDPKFRNLSQQNRYQLYSRNEQAPNINALSIVNPKTGKVVPPKVTTEGVSPMEMPHRPQPARAMSEHSAYQRRTPPPLPSTVNERSRRSLTPNSASGETVDAPQSLETRNSNSFRIEPTETCWYWLRGNCKYTAEECFWAHRHIEGAIVPSKQKTCWWWHTRGFCTKSESDCEYAHRDTGIVADPPPSKNKSVLQNAIEKPSPPPPLDDPARHDPTQMSPAATELPKSAQTCHFWRLPQGCNKPPGQCEFAHHDTGVYAGPPGSFKRVSRPSDGATATSTNAVPQNRLHIPSTNAPELAKFGTGTWPQKDEQMSKDSPQSPKPSVQSPIHITQTQVQDKVPQMPQASTNRGATTQKRHSVPLPQLQATLLLSSNSDQDALSLPVKLEVLGVSSFMRLAGPSPTLHAKQSVMANDFQHIVWSEALRMEDDPVGGIMVEQPHDATVQKLLEFSRTCSSGIVAAVGGETSRMLIYPSNAEEWKFIETEESKTSSNSLLRFRLFSNLPGTTAGNTEVTTLAAFDSRHYAVVVGESLAKLDQEQLMPAKESTRSNGDRPVFLMFPPTHQIELEVYIKYFRGFKCKVYCSDTEGAWSFFRKRYGTGCLLVVHPDVPLWQIPGLYDIIASSGGGLRIFSIGADRVSAPLEDRTPQFNCKRLFPHGNVAYITDDVFVHYPEKAAEVIRSFLKANKDKPDGAKSDRIAARPGLKEWISRLVQDKSGESSTRDARWPNLYEAVLRLCPADAEDPTDPPNPLPTSYLVSISPDLLPSFSGLWEKDPVAATDMMVEWFAGWSMFHADRHRKFVVCHEAKDGSSKTIVDEYGNGKILEELDPRGWAIKYQHIGVTSPKNIASMFVKKKK